MSRSRQKQKQKSKKVCQITGKRPHMGGSIIYRGIRKKRGPDGPAGVGLQRVKSNKRKFRPNLQRVRMKLLSGEVKRIWVSVKALKAGKVTKA